MAAGVLALKVGILDQSPVHGLETPAEALGRTVYLAGKAEEWGYHRFWVAEHHGSGRVMGSSPEVLVSHLLARTSRIRVGSGGVMLQHYSPYKVAENFNVLASLAPGRVDLGVGRGPGGLPQSTAALRRGDGGGAGVPLAEKLAELRRFLLDGPAAGDPRHGLRASPVPPLPPEVYLLGTTRGSGEMAAELGLPYVFALFLNNDAGEMGAAVGRYQSGFAARGTRGTPPPQPSPGGGGGDRGIGGGVYNIGGGECAGPYTMLALPVIVADSDGAAAGYAAKVEVVRITLDSGRTLTVGSVAAGEEFGRQSGEGYRISVQPAGVIHGGAESVRRQLLEVGRRYGADEIIAVTAINSFEQRLRSYELLGGLIDGLRDEP